MKEKLKNASIATKAVWAGEGKQFWERSAQVPVAFSVSYRYDTVDELMDVVNKKKPGHIYGRNSNPTVSVLEEKMIILENGAEACNAFPTGMGAISNTLLALLKPGDRLVSITDTYGGTAVMYLNHLPKLGIECKLCDTSNEEEILEEISRGCKVLYLESPTNPTLKINDIRKLAKAGHDVGAIVIVDNTFNSPVNMSPFELGADLVLHSCTKYLNGHSDVTGGVVLGPKDLVKKVYEYREIHGTTMDPMTAYLIMRGIKTLDMRMKKHNENGQKIAEYILTDPLVEKVFYPGLASHFNHEVAKKQMRGYGGMVSFNLKDFNAAKKFCENLQFAHNAASLGHVESLVSLPMTSSHVECTVEERKQLGIDEGLVRYSTGIEDANDLIEDIKRSIKIANR
ncbi:aminotransferase class I/II-fold pyridoxal phosphate-dependent enzyme [Bacteroidota bacterium]